MVNWNGRFVRSRRSLPQIFSQDIAFSRPTGWSGPPETGPDAASAHHLWLQSPDRNSDPPLRVARTPITRLPLQAILGRCAGHRETIAGLDHGGRREFPTAQDTIARTFVVAVPDCAPIFPVRCVRACAPRDTAHPILRTRQTNPGPLDNGW